MFFNIGALSEALSTFWAFIGLLPYVISLMAFQVVALSETLSAFWAFIGLLPCVN